jgi:hypothetical protein
MQEDEWADVKPWQNDFDLYIEGVALKDIRVVDHDYKLMTTTHSFS